MPTIFTRAVEVVWVWIPAAALVALAWLFRRLRAHAK
jgi:hypothetical protein